MACGLFSFCKALASQDLRATLFNMKLEDPDLANAHVRLEPLVEEDRELLANAGAISAMWAWMPVIGTGTNYDAYFDNILYRVKTKDMLAYKVINLADQSFAGVVSFDAVSRTHRRLRIGYPWHPESLRGSIVPLATQLVLLKRAREARFRRIEYLITDNNTRAVAFAEKLGASMEGTLRNYFRLTGGGWANMVVLSLIDAEIDGAISLLNDRTAELAERTE